MATYRAIGATCEAIAQLLQQLWQRNPPDESHLQFAVYRTADFDQPMDVGISLFLYRVTVSNIQRTPPAKPGPQGYPRRSQLPLELHFLLIPWAKQSSLEQVILGWMLRTMEDYPILPSGLLNMAMPDVFDADETVEIVSGQLSNEEMFRIWNVLPSKYQISIPYTARILRIASETPLYENPPVQIRELVFDRLKEQ
ncbi:DUF4255 domain-containing protein [Dictyobacter formicarum]|uniref:Pvc16 N-terminal domain-containing protein n=1 Tax=Dictyobacter formicarum TaxID=2778368 RepID=A0ABQ3VQG7_9CHLR|nr:DUF4255 domain-containing protein [Dictyobacter formicarum]GHO87633.1 hypothetical protein KSZ_56390 [Dictyobacter formicarum]